MILSNAIPSYEGISTFRILIIEDNASFRKSLKATLFLQFPSIVIEEVADGNEAMRKDHALLSDLIFKDSGLPGESSLERRKDYTCVALAQ